MEDAAEVAFRTIRAGIPALKHVRLIRFVLHEQDALTIDERVAEKAF